MYDADGTGSRTQLGEPVRKLDGYRHDWKGQETPVSLTRAGGRPCSAGPDWRGLGVGSEHRAGPGYSNLARQDAANFGAPPARKNYRYLLTADLSPVAPSRVRTHRRRRDRNFY